MSLRVLGGKYRGRLLEVPRSGTRPTSVMLKRRVFDALQSLDGYHFVDLCAGSGGVGIEALSRGAEFVNFVDIGRNQVKLIEKNVTNLLGETSSTCVEIHCMPAVNWVSRNGHLFTEKTIVFFDPPYEDEELYFSFFESISDLTQVSLFLIEVGNKTPFYAKIASFLMKFQPKIIKQGDREIFWF